MFRIGTNIIGVGTAGAKAAAYSRKMGIDGAGYACVMSDITDGFDICCDGRADFVSVCDRFFVNKNGVAFVAADFAERVVSSLTCEICALSKTRGSLTIAVVYMPSSLSAQYTEAQEYVEELHEIADGVVIINPGYSPDFSREVYNLLQMLSDAMNPDGARSLGAGEDLREIFTSERNIYFASVYGDMMMDGHGYHSEALSMRLDCQMHIDIATDFAYFISCGSTMPKELRMQYINAVDKKNIAYMPTKRAYIFENNPRLGSNEFVFGVLCSQ